MKIKKWKSRLDEMQEQKLLKRESLGCYIGFWGLLVVIFVQMFLYGRDFKMIAGEWTVFMCMAIYMTVVGFKDGIWSKSFAPTTKTNLAFSIAAGGVCGVLFGILSYHEYHALIGSIATGIFMFGLIFSTCFAALSFLVVLYKKRISHLENEEAKEEKENDGE